MYKRQPEGIDHALLHTVEGRLHLAHADRLRDGTGTTDKSLLESALTAFDAALGLNRELGVAWLGLARTQRMLGEVQTAGESLSRAQRLSPDNDPSIACEQALLALDNGDVEASLTHVDAAEVHGQNAITAYIRGNISAAKGQLKQALYHYTDCLTLDSAHIRARLNRCSVHMGLDAAREALRMLKRCWIKPPNSPSPEFERATLTCILPSGSLRQKNSNTCLNKPLITSTPLRNLQHAT